MGGGGGVCPNLATLSAFMCCVPGAPVVCPAPSAAGGCVPRPLGRPPVRPAPPAHTPAPAPTVHTARGLLVLRSDSCQCDLHGPRWQRKHGARTAARRGAEGTSCATCARARGRPRTNPAADGAGRGRGAGAGGGTPGREIRSAGERSPRPSALLSIDSTFFPPKLRRQSYC